MIIMTTNAYSTELGSLVTHVKGFRSGAKNAKSNKT
jgi:hypothetical protein